MCGQQLQAIAPLARPRVASRLLMTAGVVGAGGNL